MNRDLIDVFSLVHFGSGYALGKLGFGFKFTLAAGIFWDFYLERKLKCEHPEWFPHPSQDAFGHVAADTAAYLLGWKLSQAQGAQP